jgi:hypothetical protein
MSSYPQDELIENPQLAGQNNLKKYCAVANCLRTIQYTPIVTSYNNPQISKSMRYSQYIRNRQNMHTNTGTPPNLL